MGCSVGDSACEAAEKPPHSVAVSAFMMLETEVTEGQWATIMTGDPSPSCDVYGGGGVDSPVECVSWFEAKAFCEAVGGRLPTDAEWEYAARAGTTTKFYCGDSVLCLDDIAWYQANSGTHKHDVKYKAPNAFGLYDMLGNVSEWVEDCWHSSYYGAPAVAFPAWGEECVNSSTTLRGAAFDGLLPRVSLRYGYDPAGSGYLLGFRCAKSY
jgi:formylglycine-generating enzyme required for sulfatase activity